MAVVFWILITVAVGLGFYRLRCRCQFVYGLIELGAALIIIFVTIVPQTNYLMLEAGPSWWGWLLSHGAGASAGIYVLVRALDNIEKGWPPRWERTHRKLRRFFGITPISSQR